MTDERPNNASGGPGPASPLGGDSLVDKSVRFGCGAFLGISIFAGVALFAEGIGLPGLIALGILLVGVCGIFATTHGEPFLMSLLKVIKWLCTGAPRAPAT